MRVPFEIPDGSILVGGLVLYVDAQKRLQATLSLADVGVPAEDCLALAEKAIASARKEGH